MQKTGMWLVVFWLGFNFLLASGILVTLLLFRGNAPAVSILFNPNEIATLEPRVLSTMNSLATLMNFALAVYCGLALWLLRLYFSQYQRNVWLVLVISLAVMVAAGFASDSFLGNKNLMANIVSTIILGSGLLLLQFGRQSPAKV
jgi:hypothetical protein